MKKLSIIFRISRLFLIGMLIGLLLFITLFYLIALETPEFLINIISIPAIPFVKFYYGIATWHCNVQGNMCIGPPMFVGDPLSWMEPVFIGFLWGYGILAVLLDVIIQYFRKKRFNN